VRNGWDLTLDKSLFYNYGVIIKILKLEVTKVKDEYDFSKSEKNPHTKKLKRQVTMNIDSETVDYFRAQAQISGIPYQTLMNLYLSDCAAQARQLHIEWR